PRGERLRQARARQERRAPRAAEAHRLRRARARGALGPRSGADRSRARAPLPGRAGPRARGPPAAGRSVRGAHEDAGERRRERWRPMKWVLTAGVVLVGGVIVVTVIGAMLPRTHTATRTATFTRPPQDVWPVILEATSKSDVAVDVLENQPPR